ncbi:transporter [Formosa sp. PL04]|uniref:SphA family protein n=1 Tax=Formosa sp. PL04 TaxID=3081755 RepID=UPI0029817781|nr:transporter [Formosa sp. PL04]MDW5290587.1 transporter [Formosa sp. PL04]
MKITITQVLVLWGFISCLTFQAQAQEKPKLASPLQTGHYLPGIISIRDFADPAPASGLIFLDYNVFLSGDKYYNQYGNEVTEIEGPLGADFALNTDVSGYVNNPVLMWVAKQKVLGATYLAGISIPYNTVNADIAYNRSGIIDGQGQEGSSNSSVSGFSDFNVMPVYLSWGLKEFDITAGYMFYAPTGEYTPGGNNNTGLGYWSNIFQVFTYYYPMKIKGETSKALAVMFAPTYEIIGKIKDAEVTPGNRLSLDYGLDMYFTEKLSVGIYGGNNWQVGDDTGSGVYWDGTVKDQNGILGAQVGYWLWTNRLQAVAKYGATYGSKQRLKQNYFQINLTFITNALTGNKVAKK